MQSGTANSVDRCRAVLLAAGAPTCISRPNVAVMGLSSRDPERVLYKRWVLRQGKSVADVARFVERHIVPHYRNLSDEVSISLEDPGDGAVLALQRWKSGTSMRRAFSGRAYEAWWEKYQPILKQWDSLVEFHSEWECDVVVGNVPHRFDQ